DGDTRFPDDQSPGAVLVGQPDPHAPSSGTDSHHLPDRYIVERTGSRKGPHRWSGRQRRRAPGADPGRSEASGRAHEQQRHVRRDRRLSRRHIKPHIGPTTGVGRPRPIESEGSVQLPAILRACDVALRPICGAQRPSCLGCVNLLEHREDRTHKMDSHRVAAWHPDCVRIGAVRYAPLKSIWFFGMATGAIIGGALTFTWAAFGIFVCATIVVLLLGHSLGNHRKLVHDSYQCPKWLEYALVYLGVQVGLAGPIGLLRQHELRD